MSVQLANAQLYGILDLGYVAPAQACRVATELVSGGVEILQLRAKGYERDTIADVARQIHRITCILAVPLVINDQPQVARDIDAEGVHVGQDDVSIAEAREIVGPHCFVGRSTHSLEQARRAAAEGADYIGFGPLINTPTKPDYAAIGLDDIKAVHSAVPIPIFCIGGIKLENLPQIIASGARRVAIVSGLLQASDIAQYARSAKALLNRNSKI